MIEKAGLSELKANALYGALLTIKDKAVDETILQGWERKGGAVFNQEKAKAKGEPIIVRFKDKPSQEIRAALRKAGLKLHTAGMARKSRSWCCQKAFGRNGC